MYAITNCLWASFIIVLVMTACNSKPASQATSNPIVNANAEYSSNISSLSNEELIDLFASEASHGSYSAYDAIDELERRGKVAIDPLLDHLNDDRDSVGMFRVRHSTVGDICLYTLSCMVAPTPDDYSHSWGRAGIDGETHERPHHLHNTVFDHKSAREWFHARKDHSMIDLNIEGLEWWIAAESKIGFLTVDDRRDVLHPLERELNRLKALKREKQRS